MYFIQITPKERETGLVAITRSNVLSFCPKCGNAVPVDLQDFIGEEGFRLTGSSVLCPECSRMERDKHFMQRLADVLASNRHDDAEEDEDNE